MKIEQLGLYRIEAELGHGGVATVYRAFHTPLRRYVALKVLDSSLSQNTEFQQRFEQEATLAAQLEHPNIIQVYDLGVADGYQYIAMPLIEGPTLEQLIRESGPMPASRALRITAEIADALGYAHNQGVLHRDVKPSNILIRAGDHPILTDFGIARAVEGLALTRAHSLVGTPRYMSPEQARGQTLDARSDLYSLGVVLYEMLAGKAPFEAANTHSLLYMHVHEPPRPLSRERPDLSPAVRELVERCLEKSPDDRYRTAADIAAVCRALMVVPGLEMSDSTIVMPPPSTAPRSPTPTSWPPAPSYPGGAHHTPPPSRTPTPPPIGQRSDTSWPAPAPVPAGPPVQAAGYPPPQPAPPPSGGGLQVGGRRVPLALPIGLGVALLLLVGGLVVNNMNSSGRATATPTAVVAAPKPTAAPAAAPTTGPAPGGPAPAAPTTAPSPAPAAAAKPSGPAPTSPPPTAVAAAPPGSAAANEATARLNDTMAALGRRDWAAAVDLANAGLKADPKNPALAKAAVQARLGRGQQLMAQGAERDALIHFIAVREEPLRSATSPNELREAELSVPYIWGNLMSNVDPSTALFEWTKAFRRDPNFKDVRKKVYDANVNLAKQAIARNDRAAALRNLNVAREADPNGPELNDLFKSVTPTP